MQVLNGKEKAIMEAIKASISEKGYAPSVRDLCETLGYHSTSTVQMYLDRLECYGYIRREGGKSRSISLCHETAPLSHTIPLLRADAPLDAPLNAEFVEQKLNFCYCGEIPADAELIAYRVSQDSDQIAVALRQKEKEPLRTLAMIRLF